MIRDDGLEYEEVYDFLKMPITLAEMDATEERLGKSYRELRKEAKEEVKALRDITGYEIMQLESLLAASAYYGLISGEEARHLEKWGWS